MPCKEINIIMSKTCTFLQCRLHLSGCEIYQMLMLLGLLAGLLLQERQWEKQDWCLECDKCRALTQRRRVTILHNFWGKQVARRQSNLDSHLLVRCASTSEKLLHLETALNSLLFKQAFSQKLLEFQGMLCWAAVLRDFARHKASTISSEPSSVFSPLSDSP